MRWRLVLAMLMLGFASSCKEQEQVPEACIESPSQAPCEELSGAACNDDGYWKREGRIDRFFRHAEEIAGGRLTNVAHDCDGGRDVAVLAMTDITSSDRRRLDELLPSWMDVELIETRYSEDELKDFGDRAMAALEDAGLDFTGYHIELNGKVIVGVSEDVPAAYDVLSRTLPPGSFGVEELEGLTF